MTATAPSGNADNAGCLTLFGAVFAIPGAIVGVSTLRKLVAGTTDASQIILGLTMAVLFVAVGIGLIVFGRATVAAAAKRAAMSARNPNEPWLWRNDWAQGFARSEWRSRAGLMTVIGVAFLLFSAPMVSTLPQRFFSKHPFEVPIIFAFPLTGLLLVGSGAIAYLRARKFANTRLRFESVPCPTGGKLVARIETEFTFPSQAAVDVKLSCIRSYVSGGDRDRWETVLWQESQIASASADGRTSYVPVEFAIPYDARETDTRNRDDEILWRVSALSKLSGLDFKAEFLAPVFKTAASDPKLTIATLEARDEVVLRDRQPTGSKIFTRTAKDGALVFGFGRGRTNRAALAITIFSLIFIAGGLFFGIGAGESFGWFIGAIPLTLSGGVGLLLLAYGVWLWFGTTTVEVSNGELRIRKSCLGLSGSRVIPAATIREFELDPSLQMGERVWYGLKIRLANGRFAVAGGGMEKKEAEWLRGELRKDLGLERS